MQLTLKGDQPQALDTVMAWYNTPVKQRSQIFRLYGGAGVGKTTIANCLQNECRVAYMTLSGKAALVMRKKGCEGASTIHSAIYRVVEDGDDHYFELNPDSAVINDCDIIVVDEVGMVDQVIGRDLESFRKPILVLGDKFQLPPPSDSPSYFTAAPGDFTMNKVLRQTGDSPILDLAYKVLNGEKLAPGKYGDSIVYSSKVNQATLDRAMMEATQVLCGKNITRAYGNATIRKGLNRVGNPFDYLPVVGDTLICLRNDHKKGILNGEQFIVQELLDRDLGSVMAMKVKSLDNEMALPIEMFVPFNYFNGTEDQMPRHERANYDQATYSNLMTVHKAQGSQWTDGLVLDESYVFREFKRNHLYTAITRFSDKVAIAL